MNCSTQFYGIEGLKKNEFFRRGCWRYAGRNRRRVEAAGGEVERSDNLPGMLSTAGHCDQSRAAMLLALVMVAGWAGFCYCFGAAESTSDAVTHIFAKDANVWGTRLNLSASLVRRDRRAGFQLRRC
jgi:hypothetical protein